MKNIEHWSNTAASKYWFGVYKGNYYSRLILPLFISKISKYANGRLLDCGAGSVPYYFAYKDLVNENICIDWQFSPHPSNHIDIAHDLNRKWPLEPNSFDTVLFMDVIEHLIDPYFALDECFRVLKDSGCAIISVPFYFNIHEAPHDYHRFTQFAFEKYCSRKDLAIKEIEAYGGAPEIVFDIIAKILSLIISKTTRGKFSSFGTWIGLLIELIILKNPLTKYISSKTRAKFPLGYIIVIKKNNSKRSP